MKQSNDDDADVGLMNFSNVRLSATAVSDSSFDIFYSVRFGFVVIVVLLCHCCTKGFILETIYVGVIDKHWWRQMEGDGDGLKCENFK